MDNPREKESYRDKVSTIDNDGKRIWVHPKKPKGKWYNRRTYLSYFLIAFLVTAPWIHIQGEPLLMLNFLERKFVILGQVFWPQDFQLFAFAMITLVVFVILFTVVFGRLFCGWVCPQTIFMEMLFRKIEYWIDGDYKQQKRLAKQPWNAEKIVKRLGKHLIFYVISFVIANVFLAYIIGSQELVHTITDDPSNHVGGLVAISIFSFIFFFVFSYFREQVCTSICPYGRLQGVLLDKNSIIVSYDHQRGEGRALFKKGEDRLASGKGDCIDCGQCVDVCPTGIDIRNGTQLECVNCTACIDACDFMMEKTGLEKGLIRYDSDEGISSGRTFTLTNKIKAYSAVLLVLIGVFFALIFSRGDVQTTVLRARGQLYQKRSEGKISNLYTYIVLNKTNEEMTVSFRLENMKGEIELIGSQNLQLSKQGSAEGSMFIVFNEEDLESHKTSIDIGVYQGDQLLETVEVHFSSPKKYKNISK